jgi:predicted unusual protein kinase regulating ubiquinone biosynthesis (AarF/ABC1/UbiB family)
MTLAQRITYAKLILAHSRNDKEEVIRIHFKELGTLTKYSRPDIAYLMSAIYNDRDTEEITQGKNIAEFLDWLESEDPMILLPEDYLFVSRVNLLLRGMGKAFGLKMKMSTLWEKEAKMLLDSQGIQY